MSLAGAAAPWPARTRSSDMRSSNVSAPDKRLKCITSVGGHMARAIIRITVPTDVEVKGSGTSADAHEHVRAYMADVGGGWTEWIAQGGWENGDGDLVREQVRVYECAIGGREGTDEHARMHARILADELSFITTEDEVMWQAITSDGFAFGFES